MKKLIFALVAVCIPALVATTRAYAQQSDFSTLTHQENVSGSEKNSTALTEETSELSAISTKAIKDFSKNYEKVSNVKWSVITDGYAATFTHNDIRTDVFYNKKGKWAGTLKGYGEKNMPLGVRQIVKREYYDFEITYVHEAETLDCGGLVTYVVHLEDAKNIILVRVCDGIMDVWQQYNKQ